VPLAAITIFFEGLPLALPFDSISLTIVIPSTTSPAEKHSINTWMDISRKKERLTEHHMFTIEPTGCFCGDEELRAIGVLSSVGHGKQARFSVFELEIFIYW
jgi:hypothetical protein